MSNVAEVVQIVLSPKYVASMVLGRRESNGKPDRETATKNVYGLTGELGE